MEKLLESGYTVLKQILPNDLIDICRKKVLEKYNENNYRNISNNELCIDKDILNLVFNKELITLFKQIHQCGGIFKNINFRYISLGKSTKLHSDFYPDNYDLYVSWIPLDDYDEPNSIMYIKSEKIVKFPIKKGDILIFRGNIPHGSTINNIDTPRLSIDARWVKSSDFTDNSIKFYT